MALLKLDGVSKSFGNTNVLNQISFGIEPGEFVCLLGSSGSGKSTLLRLIAGLETVTEGSILLNNSPISSSDVFLKPEQRNIGMIFQDYALFPHLTIQQNIEFGCKKNSPREHIKRLIDVLNLGDLLKRYPHQLSGGQQQRVAIARSLAVNPVLLLMDEPFSNLDEWMKEEVRDELKSILRELGATVLFVTHHAMDALTFADKIMVMDEGKIVQKGSAHEIIDQPVNSKIAGIFGKVNVFTHQELNALFNLQKPAGNYFIKPEHFLVKSRSPFWEVKEVGYHGTYFDVNLKQKDRLIHVHVHEKLLRGELIEVSPIPEKVFAEQL